MALVSFPLVVLWPFSKFKDFSYFCLFYQFIYLSLSLQYIYHNIVSFIRISIVGYDTFCPRGNVNCSGLLLKYIYIYIYFISILLIVTFYLLPFHSFPYFDFFLFPFPLFFLLYIDCLFISAKSLFVRSFVRVLTNTQQSRSKMLNYKTRTI